MGATSCEGVIPTPGMLRQEYCCFKVSLGHIVRSCLKKNQTKPNKQIKTTTTKRKQFPLHAHKTQVLGSGEMVPWLRESTDLTEDPSSS